MDENLKNKLEAKRMDKNNSYEKKSNQSENGLKLVLLDELADELQDG